MHKTQRTHIVEIATVGHELAEEHLRLAAGGAIGFEPTPEDSRPGRRVDISKDPM
jgi:hypothetical protein